MSKNDGGAAFPLAVEHYGDVEQHPGRGMSLRDWFAGQLAAGWLASYGDADCLPSGGNLADFASRMYGLADAMLNERDKPLDTQPAKG